MCIDNYWDILFIILIHHLMQQPVYHMLYACFNVLRFIQNFL